MTRLETTGYYALGVPFYLAFFAAEVVLARRKGLRVHSLSEGISNVSAGIGELVVGIFLGPFLLSLYDLGYERLALFHFREGSIAPWVLAFFGGDLCYYLYHRAGHRIAGFWAVHGVHHQAEEMNVTVAMRHPWFSDTYAILFYAPMPLLGVPPTHFFVAISIISFYALTVHSRFFHRPALGIFVTPRTHILHHATNPRYIDKNFGAMFTIWDRLFGTYVEPDPADVPVLGTKRTYETHDGAKAQWIFFRDLFTIARRAPRLVDKLKVFVMPPGWLPAGVTLERTARAPRDAEISLRVRGYVAVQFAITLAFSIWVLWLRDRHSTPVLVASAIAIVWSLTSLGGLLDGRRGSRRMEIARLVGTAALFAFSVRGAIPVW